MSLSRTRNAEQAPRVEINVVPLVDVVLVLLVIFMLTATFMRNAGMPLQLPSSSTAQPVVTTPRDVTIGVTVDGDFLWEGRVVSDAHLTQALRQEAAEHGTENRVIVQGDARAAHGQVVRAMTLARQTGFASLVIAMHQEADAHER